MCKEELNTQNTETNFVPECVGNDRPFMYVVENKDGSIIPEFDNDGKETSFKTINKEEAKSLYLIGRGAKFGFGTDNGIFDILNHKFNISFNLDEHVIPVTSRENETYNDIIQYKGFITDGLAPNHVGPATLQGHTSSFHVGWKKKIMIDEERYVFFKAIFSIIMGEGLKMEFKASPNFNMDGTLLIDTGDKTIVHEIKRVGKGASTLFECNIK